MKKVIQLESIVTWLFSHPVTVPALLLVFIIGGTFGAYLQFMEDNSCGKNG
jgi:hypothetical protein